MNIIMKRQNKQTSLNSKQQLSFHSTPKITQRQASPNQSRPPYDAYKDKHTYNYFRQKSVQQHLKQLVQAVQNQPKSKKNSNFIRSISQWIKPCTIRQNQLRNGSQSQKVQKKPSLGKLQDSPNLAKNQKQQKVKFRGSPYRVFPIFIKVQGTRHIKKKASQSACNLPKIENPDYKVSQVSKIVHNKLSKVGKRQKKKIISLHSLRHKQFLQFLNKKKSSLNNSFKILNPQAVLAKKNEK